VPDTALFEVYRTEIGEDWIDYNGHLNDAGYAVLLSAANEVLLDHLGLSEDYRTATGRALYTVESHIRYLAEARRGEMIEAASLLAGADAKRLRVQTLLRRGDGTAVATGEYLYLHVDPADGVTAMPPERWAVVSALLAAHAGRPPLHAARAGSAAAGA
jgi:acyl-CoA thioester hydrolase